MRDLLIKGGTVVDGAGSPPVTADVAIDGDRIVEIGRVTGPSRQTIDADGLLVTPGFVDIHTHFDGQATWDPILSPSARHGVTSVAMGNCGVGFAPVHADRHDWLIGLMEGVEDIPGAALAEGLSWEWESFPQYLDHLATARRAIDVAAHLPHAAVRAYVMGERGADSDETPTDTELRRMVDLLGEAVEAGAVGLGSSRTEAHRTVAGDPVGTLRARSRELLALAEGLRGTQAVIQLVSDCYQSTDGDFVAAELELMAGMALVSGRPLSFSVQQPPTAPTRWRALQRWASECAAAGLQIWTQVAPRPIGVLLGLANGLHPFMRCPSYHPVAALPPAEQARVMQHPELRSRVLAEFRELLPTLPVAGLRHQVAARFDLMFRLDDPVDYDIRSDRSMAQLAAGAESAEAYVYDALLEDAGARLLYSPIFNFVDRSLLSVGEMIRSERALFGLSDAGAHCGVICDASFTTSYLTLWARDRADRLPIERIVPKITRDTARHLGWRDRGELRPGMKADVNVIELDRLGCAPPRMVHDLPAGGRRLVQGAYGYRHTIKAGQVTFVDSEHTGALPGELVRGSRTPPEPAVRRRSAAARG